jgi:hypothetical protein
MHKAGSKGWHFQLLLPSLILRTRKIASELLSGIFCLGGAQISTLFAIKGG